MENKRLIEKNKLIDNKKLEENKRHLGCIGEEKTIIFLKQHEYEILESNFRVGRLGEIDIIAQNDGYICFIEVKTRRSMQFGRPSEAVDKKKQMRIIRLASVYISKKRFFNYNIRFDVVEVVIKNPDNYEINIIKNAFYQT